MSVIKPKGPEDASSSPQTENFDDGLSCLMTIPSSESLLSTTTSANSWRKRRLSREQHGIDVLDKKRGGASFEDLSSDVGDVSSGDEADIARERSSHALIQQTSDVCDHTPPRAQTVVILLSLTMFLHGYDISVIAGTISSLAEDLRFAPAGTVVGTAQRTWMVASVSAAEFLVCVFLVVLDSRTPVSRHKTLLVSALFVLFGNLLAATAINFVMILFGRILVGFSLGLAFATLGVYVAESVHENVRGASMAVIGVVFVLGQVFAGVLNWGLWVGLNEGHEGGMWWRYLGREQAGLSASDRFQTGVRFQTSAMSDAQSMSQSLFSPMHSPCHRVMLDAQGHAGCTEVSCQMHSVISGHAHSLDRNSGKLICKWSVFRTETGPLMFLRFLLRLRSGCTNRPGDLFGFSPRIYKLDPGDAAVLDYGRPRGRGAGCSARDGGSRPRFRRN